MCELISWIEIEKGPLFLITKDIESAYGKELLEGSKGNDFLGHCAIRKFYKLNSRVGSNKENMNFWDGKLPQEIKNAWNSGQFDGMLQFLQLNDLEYIIRFAPKKFSIWIANQKVRGDYEAIKKDGYRLVRMLGPGGLSCTVERPLIN